MDLSEVAPASKKIIKSERSKSKYGKALLKLEANINIKIPSDTVRNRRSVSIKKRPVIQDLSENINDINHSTVSTPSANVSSASADVSSANENTQDVKLEKKTPKEEPKSTENSLAIISKKGIVGLRNMGSTCYMNVVIQCLNYTKPLLETFLVTDHRSRYELPDGTTFTLFSNLINEMWSETKFNNNQLLTFLGNVVNISNGRFLDSREGDAEEFLNWLIGQLHLDIVNYIGVNYTPIRDNFLGISTSTVVCGNCGKRSQIDEEFWIFSLTIPDLGANTEPLELEDCLRVSTVPEQLDDRNSYCCDRCGKGQHAVKQVTMRLLPRILTIQLIRFMFEQTTNSIRKLNTNITLPDVITLHEDITGKMCIYDLYAVVLHAGRTPASGHYTAYCKHPFSNVWHEFNDTNVRTVSKDSISTSAGYLLFYEKREDKEEF